MNVTRTSQGEIVHLGIDGELDAYTASELRPVIDAITAERPMRVVVDVSALELIDSSGVGALVSLYKRMRSYNGELTFSGLRGQPLTVFKLLNLDRIFTFT